MRMESGVCNQNNVECFEKNYDVECLHSLLMEIGDLTDICKPVKGINRTMQVLSDEEVFYSRLYMIGVRVMAYRKKEDQQRGLVMPWRKLRK